jgi:hypothetical protein
MFKLNQEDVFLDAGNFLKFQNYDLWVLEIPKFAVRYSDKPPMKYAAVPRHKKKFFCVCDPAKTRFFFANKYNVSIKHAMKGEVNAELLKCQILPWANIYYQLSISVQ